MAKRNESHGWEPVKTMDSSGITTELWSRACGDEIVYTTLRPMEADSIGEQINRLEAVAEETLKDILGNHYGDDDGLSALHFVLGDLLQDPTKRGGYEGCDTPWPGWVEEFAAGLSNAHRCAVLDAVEARCSVTSHRAIIAHNTVDAAVFPLFLQSAFRAGELFHQLTVRRQFERHAREAQKANDEAKKRKSDHAVMVYRQRRAAAKAAKSQASFSALVNSTAMALSEGKLKPVNEKTVRGYLKMAGISKENPE
jgi:hypothetical protein